MCSGLVHGATALCLQRSTAWCDKAHPAAHAPATKNPIQMFYLYLFIRIILYLFVHTL
jgi:hypothetical protein